MMNSSDEFVDFGFLINMKSFFQFHHDDFIIKNGFHPNFRAIFCKIHDDFNFIIW